MASASSSDSASDAAYQYQPGSAQEIEGVAGGDHIDILVSDRELLDRLLVESISQTGDGRSTLGQSLPQIR